LLYTVWEEILKLAGGSNEGSWWTILTSGRDDIKLWMFDFLAASIISSIWTSRLLSPYAMFSAIVRSKRTGSCDTIPNCALRWWSGTELISFPCILCRYMWHQNNIFYLCHYIKDRYDRHSWSEHNVADSHALVHGFGISALIWKILFSNLEKSNPDWNFLPLSGPVGKWQMVLEIRPWLLSFISNSGVPRNFFRGGFNKFSWGQRTERTGIWGR